MKTFGYYLKEIRRPLAVYAGTVFIFALVGYLYEVTRDAVGYALLLSAVILLVCTALDLARYLKRERRIGDTEKSPLCGPHASGGGHSGGEGVPGNDDRAFKKEERGEK